MEFLGSLLQGYTPILLFILICFAALLIMFYRVVRSLDDVIQTVSQDRDALRDSVAQIRDQVATLVRHQEVSSRALQAIAQADGSAFEQEDAPAATQWEEDSRDMDWNAAGMAAGAAAVMAADAAFGGHEEAPDAGEDEGSDFEEDMDLAVADEEGELPDVDMEQDATNLEIQGPDPQAVDEMAPFGHDEDEPFFQELEDEPAEAAADEEAEAPEEPQLGYFEEESRVAAAAHEAPDQQDLDEDAFTLSLDDLDDDMQIGFEQDQAGPAAAADEQGQEPELDFSLGDDDSLGETVLLEQEPAQPEEAEHDISLQAQDPGETADEPEMSFFLDEEDAAPPDLAEPESGETAAGDDEAMEMTLLDEELQAATDEPETPQQELADATGETRQAEAGAEDEDELLFSLEDLEAEEDAAPLSDEAPQAPEAAGQGLEAGEIADLPDIEPDIDAGMEEDQGLELGEQPPQGALAAPDTASLVAEVHPEDHPADHPAEDDEDIMLLGEPLSEAEAAGPEAPPDNTADAAAAGTVGEAVVEADVEAPVPGSGMEAKSFASDESEDDSDMFSDSLGIVPDFGDSADDEGAPAQWGDDEVLVAPPAGEDDAHDELDEMSVTMDEAMLDAMNQDIELDVALEDTSEDEIDLGPPEQDEGGAAAAGQAGQEEPDLTPQDLNDLGDLGELDLDAATMEDEADFTLTSDDDGQEFSLSEADDESQAQEPVAAPPGQEDDETGLEDAFADEPAEQRVDIAKDDEEDQDLDVLIEKLSDVDLEEEEPGDETPDFETELVLEDAEDEDAEDEDAEPETELDIPAMRSASKQPPPQEISMEDTADDAAEALAADTDDDDAFSLDDLGVVLEDEDGQFGQDSDLDLLLPDQGKARNAAAKATPSSPSIAEDEDLLSLDDIELVEDDDSQGGDAGEDAFAETQSMDDLNDLFTLDSGDDDVTIVPGGDQDEDRGAASGAAKKPAAKNTGQAGQGDEDLEIDFLLDDDEEK